MKITMNVPDELGKALNQLPNRDQMTYQALNDMVKKHRELEAKEEAEFDDAVMQALESEEMKDITKKFVEHAKTRKVYNPIKI